MDNFTIKINPQYVKQTDELEMIDGKERQLHEVQKQMKLNFEQLPEFTIITAPTGTGKSYAFPFPVLKAKKATDDTPQVRGLIVLPTNALISELTESFGKTYKEQGIIVNQLTGSELNKYDVKGLDRWRKAMEIADECDILITNPDLINFAMHGGYYQSTWHKNTANTRFSSFLKNFNYIIFDEYHLYDEAQIANILTLIKLRTFFLPHYKPQKGTVHGNRFLFVSATPEKGLEEVLREEGHEPQVITELIVNNPKNARAIHGELEVEFWNLKDFKDIKTLIHSKIPELQEVLKTKKALLILNNVRTVQELEEELQPYFKGKKIYPSTGYVSKSENHTKKIETANLIIATNKAEVGVNYDVEYCIMETGKYFQNFVQRFGRVSRGNLVGKVVVAVEQFSKYKRLFKEKSAFDYYCFVEIMRQQMQQRSFYTKKIPMYVGEYLWCIQNNIKRFQHFEIDRYLRRRMTDENALQGKLYSRYKLMKEIDKKIEEMIKHHLRIEYLTKNEFTRRKNGLYKRLEKQAHQTFEWVTWWHNYLNTYLTFRDGSKVVKIIDTIKNEELEYSLDWILQHKKVIKVETIQKEKYEIQIYTVAGLKERDKDIQYTVSTLPNAGMSGNNYLNYSEIYQLDKVFKKSVGLIYDKVRKGVGKKSDLQKELCKLIIELHNTFDRKRLKIDCIDNDDIFL